MIAQDNAEQCLLRVPLIDQLYEASRFFDFTVRYPYSGTFSKSHAEIAKYEETLKFLLFTPPFCIFLETTILNNSILTFDLGIFF